MAQPTSGSAWSTTGRRPLESLFGPGLGFPIHHDRGPIPDGIVPGPRMAMSSMCKERIGDEVHLEVVAVGSGGRAGAGPRGRDGVGPGPSGGPVALPARSADVVS